MSRRMMYGASGGGSGPRVPPFYTTNFPDVDVAADPPHPTIPGVAAKWDLVAWGVRTRHRVQRTHRSHRPATTAHRAVAARGRRRRGGDGTRRGLPAGARARDAAHRRARYGVDDRIVMLITGGSIRETLAFSVRQAAQLRWALCHSLCAGTRSRPCSSPERCCTRPWVLAFFLNSGEGPFEGFASQLAATDSATESSNAAAICSPGSCSHRRGGAGADDQPRRFLTTVGWRALGVFAGARSPIPVCRCGVPRRPARRRRFRLTHQWHAVTSTVSVTAAVVSAVAFIIRDLRLPCAAGDVVVRARRRRGCSSSAPCGCSSGSTTQSGSHSWLGFAQRVELLSMSGWMVLVAATCSANRAWRAVCTGRHRRPSPVSP